ncbi:hypothetical protein [Crateriforma conspicua]|uniref:Uncharacterized protein n=1 Tax=Crateriforma conspicua TaxID=2527996 RepID=A0A5C5Y1T6_9PLAN|nr:hypothetical protein [Crateriforma conspicua]TWT69726.1 hypothetical protein Pan14r_20180 [Crateriforma conspicua]
MGDEGLENTAKTLENSGFGGLGEAESEAIRTDAALRDLVRLWSTLSDDAKRVIATVANADAGN